MNGDTHIPTPPTSLPNQMPRGRVLVVDDEAPNRLLLRDPIESRGYEVIEARDGSEAIARASDKSPDVILLDLMMPGMNGFDVCRRLKGNPRTATIPVILVTALSGRADRLKGIEAGANDFLTKPIDISDVILRVRNAVSTRRLYIALQIEQSRSEMLLLNMLPKPIADRMKRGERSFAETHQETTVLFADLVGSSTLCSLLGPDQLVGFLNEIFSSFDTLTAQHGLEKIRSSGDQYLAVAGAPFARPGHAQAAAKLGLSFQEAVRQFNQQFETSFKLRLGIASGSLVAGVIGKRKFFYDVWGDTVNRARNLAASATPGTVLLSSSTFDLLGNDPGLRLGASKLVPLDGCGEIEAAELLEPSV